MCSFCSIIPSDKKKKKKKKKRKKKKKIKQFLYKINTTNHYKIKHYSSVNANYHKTMCNLKLVIRHTTTNGLLQSSFTNNTPLIFKCIIFHHFFVVVLNCKNTFCLLNLISSVFYQVVKFVHFTFVFLN